MTKDPIWYKEVNEFNKFLDEMEKELIKNHGKDAKKFITKLHKRQNLIKKMIKQKNRLNNKGYLI